jgi:hypothetical protein
LASKPGSILASAEAIKPEDYGAFGSTGRRKIYTKPESDWRALGSRFQNSKIETSGRPSSPLPTTTAIRIASATDTKIAFTPLGGRRSSSCFRHLKVFFVQKSYVRPGPRTS